MAKNYSLDRSANAQSMVRLSAPVIIEHTLSYDDVKALGEKYRIPGKSIYKLYAEYNSMKEIAIQELEYALSQIKAKGNVER